MGQGRPTFTELVKDWILATPRIRRIMLERSRALAKTENEKGVLRQLWAAYQEDVRKAKSEMEDEGRDTTQQEFILQRSVDGLYAGPLIHDRFQVMESIVPGGTYMLVDFTMPDICLRERNGGRDGEIRRFASRKEAEDWAAMVAGGEPGGQNQSRVERVFGRRAEKSNTMAKPKKEAAASTETKTRAPSASSRFKEMIMANATIKKPLTDDEIFDKVAAEFNLDDSKRSYVTWYRNDLRKKGENPPEPVGGAKPKASGSEKIAKMNAAKAAKNAPPPAKPSNNEKLAMKKTTAAVEKARSDKLAGGRKPGRSAAA